jgi:hypothetical protein
MQRQRDVRSVPPNGAVHWLMQTLQMLLVCEAGAVLDPISAGD